MNAAELNQVLDLMGAIWPQANVHERWADGMAIMCGELDAADVVQSVRDLALPIGKPPEWPPPPNVIRHHVDSRRDLAETEALMAHYHATGETSLPSHTAGANVTHAIGDGGQT